MKPNHWRTIGMAFLFVTLALTSMGFDGCWDNIMKTVPVPPTGDFEFVRAPLRVPVASPFEMLQQGDTKFLIGSGTVYTADLIWEFTDGHRLSTHIEAVIQNSRLQVVGESGGLFLGAGESTAIAKTYDSEGNLLFVGQLTSSDAHPGEQPGAMVRMDNLVIAGADMAGLYEADGAGVYSGKVMSMEFTMFAGLEDGQPTSWVEGKGTIR